MGCTLKDPIQIESVQMWHEGRTRDKRDPMELPMHGRGLRRGAVRVEETLRESEYIAAGCETKYTWLRCLTWRREEEWI